MSLYPGFSTARMDEIFALNSRVAAMAEVESAVAAAQGASGDIPAEAAAAIVAACTEPISVEILADGWRIGTPVIGLLDAVRSRLSDDAGEFLHYGLTTQDVVDTSSMLMVAAANDHLGELAADAASSLRRIIERSGHIATQARSFLQPADVTTVGFRV